ncbi:ecto-ADP-ribosyltransferase 5-like [Ambystoma mexicanum]|uniref:ecto-ADP-ribosyltransferase 5-like n=1 Tax=Ambystoma mexicanum TaxID=8296 RepID=UPI0037E9B410
MKSPLLGVFCLCLQLQMADFQVTLPTFTLGMNPGALDDQYQGCEDFMENQILTSLLKEEKQREPDFSQAWDAATLAWPEKKSSLVSLPEGFKNNHGIALMAYANMGTSLRKRFNTAIHEYRAPSKDFPFKTLHFYLTTALKLLHINCRGIPRRAFRAFSDVLFERPDTFAQNIRFGQFATAFLDLNVAKKFGGSSFFVVSTCYGVEIQNFSFHPEIRQVMIPVDEEFHILHVIEEGNLFVLRSTLQRCHYHNCVSLKGRKGETCKPSLD